MARIAQNRKVFRVWLGNLKTRDYFEDLGVDDGGNNIEIHLKEM